eukprot:gnl/MRDRNA2_/MRDRNA2_133919_c0_seq1.p1 gnl/MRDRNA2_/MRDRNA2_133919_c0~~gnl/MRDRNA2_/MRDRNA2_133919_c0_seq1.p1  ORF type:complete len:295 (-),score=37.62 gnl/MRDRNA2_/MRDRNA2_133919_c0_seq1:154-1038(-)
MGCYACLKQGIIMMLIAFLNVCIMALLIVIMTVPFWREKDKKGHPGKGVPLAHGSDRENGMFYIMIWMTCIGAVVVSFGNLCVVLFGDMLISRIGLSWFSDSIKLTMYRACNNAIASLCWAAILSAMQCKKPREESYSVGFYLLFPTGFTALVSVFLIYYYPCAPSGGGWSTLCSCCRRKRRRMTDGTEDEDDFNVDGLDSDDSESQTRNYRRNYGTTTTGKSKTTWGATTLRDAESSSDDSDSSEENWWASAMSWGQSKPAKKTPAQSSTQNSLSDEEDGRGRQTKNAGWGFW